MNPGQIWDKYSSLELWKRVLLIVPALVAIVLVAFYIFMQPKCSSRLEGALLEDLRQQSDEEFEESQDKIEELREEEDGLEYVRDVIKEELKDNGQIYDNIDARISAADSLEELERIRKDIIGQVERNSD